MMFPRRNILLFLLLFTASWAMADGVTKVRGVVRAVNGDPVQFASVYFPNTTVGVLTDERGLYSLETREDVDSLEVSIVGFRTDRQPVRRGAFNTLDFYLEPEPVAISGITVRPGENPAHPILDSVRKYRYIHDMSQCDSFESEIYSKMEMGFSNVRPRFKTKALQKRLGFVFDYMDTVALTGRTYLPAIISETTSRIVKVDGQRSEEILATKVSGVDNTQYIAKFTGQLETEVNFYEAHIAFLGARFIGPLSPSGTMYYKYFLVDSMQVEGRKTYRIRFHPRNVASPVFDGEIDIDAGSYAIRSVIATMPKGLNVNWVRALHMESDHRPLDSLHWVNDRDCLMAEIAITKSDSTKMVSLFGRHEVFYSGTKINQTVQPLSEKPKELARDSAYWAQKRPYRLSEREEKIFEMVDSVKQTPIYRTAYDIVNTVLAGYYNTKYIGFGPYSQILSFNNIETVRFQIGMRTTKNVSRKVRVGAYCAYGFSDEKFKGGGELEVMVSDEKFRKLSFMGYHDLLQMGDEDRRRENLITTTLSAGGRRLSMVNMSQVQYEHEYNKAYSSTFIARFQQVFSNKDVEMFTPDLKWADYLTNVYFSASFRIARGETMIRSVFDKHTLEIRRPITTFTIFCGFPKVLDKQYSYVGLDASIRYKPDVAPFGYIDMMLKGGFLHGHVPYHFILAKANRTYVYDQYSFSCMRDYEFAADRYLSFFYEHHLKGALFGRIPGLKKLRWREIVMCKGYWGLLSKYNDGTRYNPEVPLLFPQYVTVPRIPYVEVGFGVENILRIFRVDFIWRVTNRDNGPSSFVGKNFTINATVHINF